MPLYFLETSALLKRYRSEVGSNFITELITGQLPGEAFSISYFTALEVVAVLRRRWSGGYITRRGYSRALSRFVYDCDNIFNLRPVNTSVVIQAIAVAESHALRGGDALQFATALTAAEEYAPHPVILICSDREIVRAGQADGLTVIDPEDPTALARLHSLRRQ